MKKNTKLFLTLAVCGIGFLVPFNLMGSSRAGVRMEYEEDSYYDYWTGPGWYYGIWFNNEDEYEYWLANKFDDVIWVGPGWYYGFWFDSEPYFHRYRKSHKHHGGDRHHRKGQGNPSLHQQQQRAQPLRKQQQAQPQRTQPQRALQPKADHSRSGKFQKSHGGGKQHN